MNNPLRILAVFDLPWDPRLGAARVWIELAEQWKRAGHSFEKFCLTDAFPKSTSIRPLAALRRMLFPSRAADYVRNNATRFDVVDSLLGTLPFSKTQLSFGGLLVGHSAGLQRSYEEFIQFSKKRWPDQPRGTLVGRAFYDFIARGHYRNAERALSCCDLLNLANEDEKSYVQHQRVIVEPVGLNESERTAFAAAMQPPNVRLNQKQVCFIGMWSLRKGSRDWGPIIRRVRESVPDAQFLFLGTVFDDATVFADLNLSDTRGIRCVQTYRPADLPALLGPCAVGIFPSYIEGCPIGVIEQLACGIPTIAYDVAGPRQIFGDGAPNWLMPAGNIEAMARRAVEILLLGPDQYAELSAQCRAIADRFRWEQIAADTAREYAEALNEMKMQARPRNMKPAAA